MVKLRRFSPSDLKEIMEIEKASFPEPWSESFIKKLSREHTNGFIIAEFLNKGIVGYILGYKKPNELGSIKTVVVNPRFRRQGI